MKNLSVLAASAALSVALTACGDDSSSASNVEREEDSSSSVAEESSSSVEEIESSSEEEAPKARAATLEDLEKNYSLGEMFGTKVYLATGAKKGVFSLWIPDTAWVAFRSDFKDGVLEFGKKDKNGGWAGATAPAADSLNALLEKGAKIKIIMNEEEKLQYSINGGDFKDLEVAKVKFSDNTISDGTKLDGMSLSCAVDGKKTAYSFFEGRYLAETEDSWEAGYYDVQRSRLLMLPTFYDKPVYPLTSMTVGSDFNMLDITGKEISCESAELKYKAIDHDKLAGEWVSDVDYDWTLNLDKSGSYSIVASKGGNAELNNSGNWDVYGNILLIKNSLCTNTADCLTGIKGTVSGFDASKGFKLDHSNTEKPAMPTSWGVPQYE